jgi:glycosyltransferase involved in cell wall biosynthesis
MKPTLQIIIKYISDIIVFPIIISYVFILRFLGENRKKTRVFLGLMANNNLIYVRDALLKLDYEAKVIPWIIPAHERGAINYDLDIALRFPRMYRNFFGQLLLIYGFFFWALYKFDVFIMPFRNRLLDRTGFLMCFEFQLLHMARKKIILNPYGGDIQFSEVWKTSDNKAFKTLYLAWESDPYYSNVSSNKTLKNTRYCQQYADALIIAIDWPDYLEESEFNYLHMRCVPKISDIFSKSASKNDLFTIFHATNHAHFKGTKYLEKAVLEINKNGKICELIIFKDKAHNNVLKGIQNADVVFDQILLGAYGRLAIEAMSLGKPVICYLREDLKKLYKIWDECPIINANIDNIKEKILELMKMSNEGREIIGQKSIEYVHKYHSPEYVGERLHQIIQKVVNNDTGR